jgi:hypothetical protein
MSDISEKVNEDLNKILNLGSVIIGVLVFLTATAWIDFFRMLTDEVFLNVDDDIEWYKRYGRTWRALLFAIINVIVLLIAIILIYSWYQREHAIIQCSRRS